MTIINGIAKKSMFYHTAWSMLIVLLLPITASGLSQSTAEGNLLNLTVENQREGSLHSIEPGFRVTPLGLPRDETTKVSGTKPVPNSNRAAQPIEDKDKAQGAQGQVNQQEESVSVSADDHALAPPAMRSQVALAAADSEVPSGASSNDLAGNAVVYRQSELTNEQTTLAYRTAAISGLVGSLLIVSSYVPSRSYVRDERMQYKHSQQHGM